MNATEELRRMLDKFERDLCHAGCGAKCGTHEERRALIDGVKDRYAQAIAATLGGGKLTKEDVQRALFAHSTYANYDGLQLYANGIRTQEIADELNATLGGGECELAEVDSYSNANEVIHVLECSACGHTCEHVNGSYPRCPHCGTKAAKR